METTKQDAQNRNPNDNHNQQPSFLYRFEKKPLLYGIGSAALGLGGVPLLFSSLGFSSIGVTAGSYAAAWQSTHYLPGLFALLQSVSATNAVGHSIAAFSAGVAVTKVYIDEIKKKSEN